MCVLLGLPEARDLEIFMKAKAEVAIVMTKEADLLQLLEIHGVSPKII